jgi:hypothetical protein
MKPIESMTPEELRTEIATIKGAYPDKNYHSMGGAMLLPPKNDGDKPRFLWQLLPNIFSGEVGWDPTNDKNAAFELIDGIRHDMSIPCAISMRLNGGTGCSVTLYDKYSNERYVRINGDNLLLAICQAYLTWTRIKKGRIHD